MHAKIHIRKGRIFQPAWCAGPRVYRIARPRDFPHVFYILNLVWADLLELMSFSLPSCSLAHLTLFIVVWRVNMQVAHYYTRMIVCDQTRSYIEFNAHAGRNYRPAPAEQVKKGVRISMGEWFELTLQWQLSATWSCLCEIVWLSG